LKGQQNISRERALEITLDWNKVDLANSDIFDGRENFSQEQLQVIMEKALKLNNPSFVLLLIQNNFQIEKFSTYSRFYDAKNGLYNYKIKVIIFIYLKRGLAIGTLACINCTLISINLLKVSISVNKLSTRILLTPRSVLVYYLVYYLY